VRKSPANSYLHMWSFENYYVLPSSSTSLSVPNGIE